MCGAEGSGVSKLANPSWACTARPAWSMPKSASNHHYHYTYRAEEGESDRIEACAATARRLEDQLLLNDSRQAKW